MAVLWLAIYRKPEEHPRCSQAELEYIGGGLPENVEKIPWLRLLPHRQTWAFVLGKFLTDPIWWFYLLVPDFLQRKHGLQLIQIGIPIVVIYVISDAGSVVGGWISSRLVKRGASVNLARKTAMLICAVSVVPMIFAYRAASLWGAVFLIGLATAAHQGFSANLFTLPSDISPKRAVGSIVGIGGMAGAVGGMLIAKIVGYALQWTGSYRIPFLMAGTAYLVALLRFRFWRRASNRQPSGSNPRYDSGRQRLRPRRTETASGGRLRGRVKRMDERNVGLTRREFLKDTAAVSAGVAAFGGLRRPESWAPTIESA